MLARLALATFTLAVTCGWAISFQDAPVAPAGQLNENLTLKEQILARQYQEFEQQVLRLKQRLERSAKQDDRDRAAVLGRVLEYCKQKSLSTRFDQMIDVLKSKELGTLPGIKDAVGRSSDIADELQAIIAMLSEDTRANVVKAKIDTLKNIMKDLDRNIQDQQSIRGMTDNGKTDRDELKRNQEMVAKRTADIEKRLKDHAAGDPASGAKQVKEANDQQEQAKGKIEAGDNEGASGAQGEAVRKLEAVRDRLNELLRQLREEEIERIMASLLVRCEKMLAMQLDVLTGTATVDKAIQANDDKKPGRGDKLASLKLSDKEAAIVAEATKAIDILEADGSAVAFPEVFQQLRDDMKLVQHRLGIADAGRVTQHIERDIVETLKEMIAALKKKHEEAANPPPPPGPPGATPPKQDPKLLETIAELKLIRSLQMRVASRTQAFGSQYHGEQAEDPLIRRELRDLAERQERIFEATRRLAKGDDR